MSVPPLHIPEVVGKMMLEQGIIFVATSSKDGVPNVSPRTAFWKVDHCTLAWCDWFRRKTFWNWQKNNHVSVAVVDTSTFMGWQLKGTCERIEDPDVIAEIVQKVMTKPPHALFNRTMQQHAGKYPPIVVKFRAEEIYSLAPEEDRR